MKSNTGLVFIDLTEVSERETLRNLISKSTDLLPDGRNLVAVWQTPNVWAPQLPIEAWVTEAALGSPTDRHDTVMEFFGNGVVRTYFAHQTSPNASWNWISFRKTGDKAYKRRATASADVIRSSTIETLLPVFTRDTSNNVWHLPHQGSKTSIRERFQVLLTWTDEITLEVRPQRVIQFERPNVSFSEGLIGAASKIEYLW